MRIAIVNDMNMAVESLRRVVQSVPEHEVAWIARNGLDAVRCCMEDLPDLILMDLIMPEMNGVEAVRRIMAGTPCPILVVTASVTENVPMVFEAMGAGALDAVSTPVLGLNGKGKGKETLLQKIRTISRLHGAERRKLSLRFNEPARLGTSDRWLIALGASTGGPGALVKILSGLPKDLQASVVVVQHVDENFTPALAEWLARQSVLPVSLAREGDKLAPGTVFVAGTNNHLLIKEDSRLGYRAEPIQLPYRPSVDVFFDSILKNWPGKAIAVLLTGMGRDGAEGLLRLRRSGAYTIAQNAETCKIYGMPKAAIELNAAEDVLPIDGIADVLAGRIPGHLYADKKVKEI